jgi:hypothetical protein
LVEALLNTPRPIYAARNFYLPRIHSPTHFSSHPFFLISVFSSSSPETQAWFILYIFLRYNFQRRRTWRFGHESMRPLIASPFHFNSPPQSSLVSSAAQIAALIRGVVASHPVCPRETRAWRFYFCFVPNHRPRRFGLYQTRNMLFAFSHHSHPLTFFKYFYPHHLIYCC